MHKLLVNNCYLIHMNFAVCIFNEKLTKATSRRTPANVHTFRVFASSYGHFFWLPHCLFYNHDNHSLSFQNVSVLTLSTKKGT